MSVNRCVVSSEEPLFLYVAKCEDWSVILQLIDGGRLCYLFNCKSKEKIFFPIIHINYKSYKCLFPYPPTNPQCFVCLMHKFRPLLLLIDPIKRTWTSHVYTLHGRVPPVFRDVVCFNGKLYGLFGDAQLTDITVLLQHGQSRQSPQDNLHGRFVLPHTSSKSMQLILSCGELYLVLRNSVLDFKVFKMVCERGWSKVNNLNGNIFLLTTRYSRSLSAKEFGVEENCIYVMDDKDKKTLYVYRLDDESLCILKNGQRADNASVLYDGLVPWMKPPQKLYWTDQVPCKEEKVVKHAEGNKPEECSWSKLPEDLQIMIAKRITTGWDYMNLRATSRVCRSLVPPLNWKLNPTGLPLRYPWLMFLHKGVHTFYDPMCNVNYHLDIGELRGCKICCCRDGWLLVFRPPLSMFFFEPFSRAKIELPDLLEEYHMDGISLSDPPTSSKWSVFGMYCLSATMIRLNYMRYGDETWTYDIIVSEREFIPKANNIVVWGQSFYCLGQDGCLGVFQWIGLNYDFCILDKPLLSGLKTEVRNFLVSNGDQRLVLVSFGHAGTSVHIYELYDRDTMWKPVRNLKEDTLFLSQISSLAVQSRNKRINNTIQLANVEDNITYGNVFYSLGKRRYETFDHHWAEDLYNTREILHGMWIQPLLVPDIG